MNLDSHGAESVGYTLKKQDSLSKSHQQRLLFRKSREVSSGHISDLISERWSNGHTVKLWKFSCLLSWMAVAIPATLNRKNQLQILSTTFCQKGGRSMTILSRLCDKTWGKHSHWASIQQTGRHVEHNKCLCFGKKQSFSLQAPANCTQHMTARAYCKA